VPAPPWTESARKYGRASISGAEFRQIIQEIAKNPHSGDAADTVALLGYSGIRSGEGMLLKWKFVDFDLGLIHLSETKSYASFRTIPMFPPLRTLLEQLEAKTSPKPNDPVLTAA